MKTYSVKTINLARILLIAQQSKNDLEKFLIQQNLIQFLLINLVKMHAKFLDKKTADWIESKTLGNLINLYKINKFANQQETSLVSLLDQYNQKRRFLTHKIFEEPNFNIIMQEAKHSNEIGRIISERLMNLLTNETNN